MLRVLKAGNPIKYLHLTNLNVPRDSLHSPLPSYSGILLPPPPPHILGADRGGQEIVG